MATAGRPPAAGSDPTDATLSSEVVARVLRRASDLDPSTRTGGRHGRGVAGVHGVGEAALLAAAHEVGLPVEALRRSIAVERLGPAPGRRRGDRLLGASVVTVDDEIDGTVADVLDRVDAWMVDGHHLRRERLRDHAEFGHGEWTRRTGLVGRTLRTVRNVTGEGRLGELRRVTVTAYDTGVGTCVVRVAADRSKDRQTFVGGGAAVAVMGTAGVVVAAAIASPLVLISAPAALVAGAGVAARGRGRADRTRREVERLLDAVDDRTDPTRLRTDVARRVAGRARRR